MIGSVTATEINAVSGWLDQLTTTGHLPTKLFVIHQFTDTEITSRPDLIPSPQDRAEVHRIIYDELCQGMIREQSRQTYRDAILRLVRAGAEGVILGCTEIELLISNTDSPVPVFPTTSLHVQAAVDASLNPSTTT